MKASSQTFVNLVVLCSSLIVQSASQSQNNLRPRPLFETLDDGGLSTGEKCVNLASWQKVGPYLSERTFVVYDSLDSSVSVSVPNKMLESSKYSSAFQTRRVGRTVAFSIRPAFLVSKATFSLSLGFAQFTKCATGMRTMTITVDKTSLPTTDVFEKVGCGRALFLNFSNVLPDSNGLIKVRIRKRKGAAHISVLCLLSIGSGSGAPSLEPSSSKSPTPSTSVSHSTTTSNLPSTTIPVFFSPLASMSASISIEPNRSASLSILPTPSVLAPPSQSLLSASPSTSPILSPSNIAPSSSISVSEMSSTSPSTSKVGSPSRSRTISPSSSPSRKLARRSTSPSPTSITSQLPPPSIRPSTTSSPVSPSSLPSTSSSQKPTKSVSESVGRSVSASRTSSPSSSPKGTSNESSDASPSNILPSSSSDVSPLLTRPSPSKTQLAPFPTQSKLSPSSSTNLASPSPQDHDLFQKECQAKRCTSWVGQGDYKVIGNSMVLSDTFKSCVLKPSSGSRLVLPPNAIVKFALLIWSASDLMPAHPNVRLNSVRVFATRTESTASNGVSFYTASAEVTDLVTTSGTYVVGGMPLMINFRACRKDAFYAAWTLAVLYESASLPLARTIYCLPRLVFTAPAGIFDFSTSCLGISSPGKNGRSTVVAFEGDEHKGEYFYINNFYYGYNLYNGSTAPKLDILTFDTSFLQRQGQQHVRLRFWTHFTPNLFGSVVEGLLIPIYFVFHDL